MNLVKHTENGYGRLEIRDPQTEELFSGELLRAIVTGRSLPWAWRDQRHLIRLIDDFGTSLAYSVIGYDHELDTWRLQLETFGGH